MTAMRRICVVTGTRAEYGLLYWTLKLLKENPDVELQIIACAMHLSPEYGYTYRIIESDGFEISRKVSMLLSDDSEVGLAKSAALGTIGFAEAFDQLQPDVIVVLGDRFEILSAVQSAMFAKIPVAHIHGGESTEGLIDEAIRHAVTKMSHLHFVAAEQYRTRVIQMGEQPSRVWNAGAPGLDWLTKINWMSRNKLESELSIKLKDPVFLITYHPVTLESDIDGHAFAELLKALDEFPDATKIFTYPNADTRGRVIIDKVMEYVESHGESNKLFKSLGQTVYLSLMRECDVVIGNSSSGLTEAPALKKATVNLGDRQRGRLKASSVIDCQENEKSIALAIQQALSDEFQASLSGTHSLYGQGRASEKIATVLSEVNLHGLLKKEFFNN